MSFRGERQPSEEPYGLIRATTVCGDVTLHKALAFPSAASRVRRTYGPSRRLRRRSGWHPL